MTPPSRSRRSAQQRLRGLLLRGAIRALPPERRAQVLAKRPPESRVRGAVDQIDTLAFRREHRRQLRRKDVSVRRTGSTGRLVLVRHNRRMTVERARQRALGWVADVLDGAGIAYFVVPSPVNEVYRLGVLVDHRAAALKALRKAAATSVWYARPDGKAAADTLLARLDRDPATFMTLAVYERWEWPRSSFRLGAAAGVSLEFWLDTGTQEYDLAQTLASAVERTRHEPVWVAPVHNPISPVVPSSGRELVSVTIGERAYPTAEVLIRKRYDDITFPVDVVYTWVDGDDPEWQAEKDLWASRELGERHPSRVAEKARFEDHQELRYSLRSVEQFMPWVRRIFIVTADQVPSWLDTDHPKITMVSHRDIFPADSLPTYNSHALGARLHHIEGLSEHYLYFNDDVFAGRPLSPNHFFEGNGISKFFPTRARYIDPGPAHDADLAATLAAKNNRTLLMKEFGRMFPRTMRHTAHAQVQSIFAELEERFPEEYDRTIRSRFRSKTDLSIAGSLHHYYAYVTGRAVPGKVTYGYIDFRASTFGDWTRVVQRDRPEMFCVNDPGVLDSYADPTGLTAVRFLRRYFPAPSSFEFRRSSSPDR